MKNSNALLALSCAAAAVFVGCSSNPSAFDKYLATSASRPNPVAAEVQQDVEGNASQLSPERQVSVVSPQSSEHLEQLLRSDLVSDRVAACEQLGSVAAGGDGELEAVEQLARVLQSDESMEVRIAATNALGAIHDERDGDQLATMIPEEELPSPPAAERMSFLERFWR